jgi:hypothetical protein
MINDYFKRFTRLDPSLSSYGKRAYFSVVSNKTSHMLLSLEAKPKKKKMKQANDLIKLLRELKDTMKGIRDDGLLLCVVL